MSQCSRQFPFFFATVQPLMELSELLQANQKEEKKTPNNQMDLVSASLDAFPSLCNDCRLIYADDGAIVLQVFLLSMGL